MRELSGARSVGLVMPVADVGFGELLLLVFALFVFGVWAWIVFTLITDLLRDRQLSGWWKAVWVLFLLIVPFLTGLVYLIARGDGMSERMGRARDAKGQSGARASERPGVSRADEVAQLQGLHERGTLTDVEFESAKARVLG